MFQEAEKEQKGENRSRCGGVFGYFIKNYRVTFLLIFGLILLGMGAVLTLPRESTPEVEIPFAAVVAPWPGASSRDVEKLVTKPIEDELVNLEGVKEITSSSGLGLSTVSVEFYAEEDLDEAIRRLRESVDNVTGLPEQAEDVQVVEVNFSDQPIVTVSLGGIKDERLLSLYADDLADVLEDIQGISGVDVVGIRNEEIKVVVSPARLAELGLSMGQVISEISSANLNAPFGQLETEEFNYDLRLLGGFEDIGDVASTPVTLRDGRVVLLSDLAEVKMVLSDVDSISRVNLDKEQESAPAVTMLVRKKTGGNIVKIVDSVRKEIKSAEDNWLPAEVEVAYFIDNAEFVRESLRNVATSGAQTLVIVFALLWLFLGWRAAVITALSVPLTFFMSFIIFDLTGNTLNDISLFSLILSLGLLVDNTIVIVEGVFAERKEGKIKAWQAKRVVDRFKKPLVGGTLTTVAAFFPMLLVTGIIGEFLQVIPTVVTGTLLSSLVVALAFIPAMAVWFIGHYRGGEVQKERIFDGYFNVLKRRYCLFIDWFLRHRGWQNVFISLLVVLMIMGLSLPFTPFLRTGLFPATDIDFLIINIELPPGSRLEQTDQVAEKIENIVRGLPETESYSVSVGRASTFSISAGGGSSNAESLASFYVNLHEDRERSSLEISGGLREIFKEITEAKVVIEEVSAGPPTVPPVELRVVGDNLDELDRVSKNIIDELEDIPGAINIDRNLRYSSGEFNFVFDREVLAKKGLSAAGVAQFLRVAVFGAEATTFLNEQGEEISVSIESEPEVANSVDDILKMPILNSVGERVTLGQVAKVDLKTSVDAIRHEDGERAIAVTADAVSGVTPNEITQEIMKRVEDKNISEGVKIEFGGEQQETLETFAQLYRSMVIAVILILIILVVEFNSYRQPLIIFLAIPLALIGVLFGLLIFRGQLNFSAFIGLVSLTGIVVNNAIILVDRMNADRREGKSTLEAVREAAESRLRPIILTTVTTAAGVAPLIWVDEFFRDMAVTLITGLLFSSILTLVLIPVLYYRQQRKLEIRIKN